MRPMRSIPSQSWRVGRIPHQWRHRHLGEEAGITGTVLEAGIMGTVLEAGITGTVQVGITGARLQRPKVLMLRSPMRPMRSIPNQSWRVGRIPHQWRHRHLGEEVSAQLTMLVGSARASLECAAAGTFGASSSADPRLAMVAAAGTVKDCIVTRVKPSSAEFLMGLH